MVRSNEFIKHCRLHYSRLLHVMLDIDILLGSTTNRLVCLNLVCLFVKKKVFFVSKVLF